MRIFVVRDQLVFGLGREFAFVDRTLVLVGTTAKIGFLLLSLLSLLHSQLKSTNIDFLLDDFIRSHFPRFERSLALQITQLSKV